MKIEIRPAPLPPKEVVITMTIEEARELHNAAYAHARQRAALSTLSDALTTAGVQLPANN